MPIHPGDMIATIHTVSRPSSSAGFRVGQIVNVEGRPHLVVEAWRGSPDADEDLDGRAKHYASVRLTTEDEIAAARRAETGSTRSSDTPWRVLYEMVTTAGDEFAAMATLSAGDEVVTHGMRFRLVDGIVWYMFADRDGEVRGSARPEAVALFTALLE